MNIWICRLFAFVQIAAPLALLVTDAHIATYGLTFRDAIHFFLFGAGLLLAGFIGGILVLFDKPVGFRISQIVQAIQVPFVSSPLLLYSVGYFALIDVKFVWLNILIDSSLSGTPTLRFHIPSPSSPFQIGVNLVAVLGFLAFSRRVGGRSDSPIEDA